MAATRICSSTSDTRTGSLAICQARFTGCARPSAAIPPTTKRITCSGTALQTAGNAAEAAREKELAKQLGVNTATSDLERLKVDIDVADSLRVAVALVAAEQRDQRDIAAFHLDQARQLFAKGRDDDAIAELRRTIFLAPYESEAHLLLARIYLRTGRMQEAIDALTIAVWSDPSNTEARDLLESLR